MSTRGWYIKHPVDFERDARMLQLRALGGFEATGAWWAFVAELVKRPGYLCAQCDHSVITLGMSCDPQSFAKYLDLFQRAGLLVVQNDGLAFPDLAEWRREFDNKRRIALHRANRTVYPELPTAVSSQCNHTVSTVCAQCGDNNSYSNSIYNDLNNNSAPPGAGNPDEQEKQGVQGGDPSDRLAADALEAEAAVAASQVFATTGRRPMKKYPEIWLTRNELADVFRALLDRGVPSGQFYRVFHKVRSKLITGKAQGRKPEMVASFNWLTGWALEETLREMKAENDLKRSEKYLAKAVQ